MNYKKFQNKIINIGNYENQNDEFEYEYLEELFDEILQRKFGVNSEELLEIMKEFAPEKLI